MTAIPEKTCTINDIVEWYQLNEQLTALKNKEMLLRKFVFDSTFTAPTEGTNSSALPDNWVLKGKYVLNRKLDIDALNMIVDDVRAAGIVPENLIKWTPSLEEKEYKRLTDVQRALFDNCLTIKPGSPSLEIVMPKRASKSVGAPVTTSEEV